MELTDIGKAFLGSGYDVCGEYADGVSIKKRLFDLSKVPEKDIRHIPNTSADYFSVHGTSYKEFQQSLAEKAGLSGSYELFSASVTSSFSSTDLTIAESGFVSVKLFMRYETLKMQAKSKEYMYPEVLDDFKKLDGKSLIEQYGAAVVTGLDIGGQWSDNFTVSKLFENATSDVAASMEAAYSSFVHGSASSNIATAIKNKSSIASRRVNVVGGDPRYAPAQLEDWQASVKASPAFMNFTSDGLVWIWEFFPEYKEKLQEGLKAYIKDHEINITQKSLIKCEVVDGYQYATDADSGAHGSIALYKPATSGSTKYIGVNGNSNSTLIVKELSANYGALREVNQWHPVWNDRGSGNHHDYNCWLPVAPSGDYVALGVFCRFRVGNQGPPSDAEAEGFVVVHKSLVKETDFETTKVWSDAGSGADHSLTLGRLPHHVLWPYSTTDPHAGVLPTKYTFKDEYYKK